MQERICDALREGRKRLVLTQDEMALPLAVADTPGELAKMIGVREQTVCSCICNSKKHKYSKYLKVVLDDEIY